MKTTECSKIAWLFSAGLMGGLTGCVGYVDGPRQQAVYAPPPPVQVEPVVVVQDDYVYYPNYEVYYSNSRRQYFYRDGRSWVSRPAPPRVSVDVLVASPSVRLNFHDSPATHHATVVRQYPKHWTPPGASRDNRDGRDDGNKRGRN